MVIARKVEVESCEEKKQLLQKTTAIEQPARKV